MKKESMLSKGQVLKFAGKSVLAIVTAGMVSVAASGLTAEACTAYYAGKAVTTDGSILFGRTEDIGRAYNKIYIVEPAADHEEGAMYTDATAFTMPLPSHTYRFTACEDDPAHGDGPFGETGTNEMGVSMSATESASPAQALEDIDPFTATGITESSMVNAVLPCITTAREGIELMADIIDTYGAGEGNTLLIGDKDECWYMEILTGHQYVAIKMPEDKAAIMPNCFMLEYVDVSDSENVIASDDILTIAETAGTLVMGDNDTTLHVRNSYASTMSAGNSYRAWGGQIIFNETLKETSLPTDTDLPLFVDPDEPVSVKTLYDIAGTQYEGTEYEGQVRVIGTSSSVECHIFQIRDDMPTELATLQWMCMGSADLSTFVPHYSAAITDTHPDYQVENLNYDENSAYWTFRSLATLAGSSAVNSRNETVRSLGGVNVKAYWGKYMDDLIARQADVDAQMMNLYNTDASAVSEKATTLGMAAADETIATAKLIYSELMTNLCSGDGSLRRAFNPSVAANGVYSTYSFDSSYVAEDLPGDIASLTTQLSTALNELNSSKTALTSAQSELESTKTALKSAQTELESTKTALASAQAELESTKAALKSAENMLANTASLEVAKTKVTLKVGKKTTIRTTTNPSAKVTFKSNNKKVAAVTAKGVVHAKKTGTAAITVKANGLTRIVLVTVKHK